MQKPLAQREPEIPETIKSIIREAEEKRKTSGPLTGELAISVSDRIKEFVMTLAENLRGPIVAQFERRMRNKKFKEGEIVACLQGIRAEIETIVSV